MLDSMRFVPDHIEATRGEVATGLCVRAPTASGVAATLCTPHPLRGLSHIPHFRRAHMNLIAWLVIGGVIGWLASLLMKTDGQQGIILNVVVGIVGAMLAGWFISPLVGVGTINQSNFSLPALLVSFVGAALLLGIVNLVRRGAVR
jgi:uncharacterized membrane protein YeaQ/YmgE (transglycosylase-associated protein family)